MSIEKSTLFRKVLVGHNGISAYNDLSANGKYGTVFRDDDAESFAKALSQAIDLSSKSGIRNEIENHAAGNFYWSGLVSELDKRLREK